MDFIQTLNLNFPSPYNLNQSLFTDERRNIYVHQFYILQRFVRFWGFLIKNRFRNFLTVAENQNDIFN